MTEINMGGEREGVKGPDWSDMGTMELVLPPGSTEGPNPLGANVKLEKMPEYFDFYKPKFEAALEKSPNGKAYDINNSIMAVLERPKGSKSDQRLKLVPLSTMSKAEIVRLEKNMREDGFVATGLPVPHSGDQGQWISRCIRHGETNSEYSKRIRDMDEEYKKLGIKTQMPTN